MLNLGCIENTLMMEDYEVKNIKCDYLNRELNPYYNPVRTVKRRPTTSVSEPYTAISLSLKRGDEIISLDTTYEDVESFAADMMRLGEIVTKVEKARGGK